ncbi:hypothetical protein D3C81_375830 [compost metagenome]
MIIFDVKELGRSFLMPFGEPQGVREHLALEVLRYSVDIFNDPHLMQNCLGDAEEVFEGDYDVMGVAELIVRHYRHILKITRSYGWDPRTKAKLEFKRFGKGFHQARVMMDLEETTARMLSEARLDLPAETHVTDIVSDNPSSDVINELSTVRNGETRRRVPVLSDRHPTFVRDDSWANGGTGNWERYGEASVLPLRLRGPGRAPEDDGPLYPDVPGVQPRRK